MELGIHVDVALLPWLKQSHKRLAWLLGLRSISRVLCLIDETILQCGHGLGNMKLKYIKFSILDFHPLYTDGPIESESTQVAFDFSMHAFDVSDRHVPTVFLDGNDVTGDFTRCV